MSANEIAGALLGSASGAVLLLLARSFFIWWGTVS